MLFKSGTGKLLGVNLLNLQELKEALRKIGSRPDMETLTLREKSAFAAGMLSEISSRRGINNEQV